MELGPSSHDKDGLLGLISIMVVYMEPLGVMFSSGVNSVFSPPGAASKKRRG